MAALHKEEVCIQFNHFTPIYASLCMISGFHHTVAENCALLGNYTASSGTWFVMSQKSAVLMYLWFVNCHLYVFIYWLFSFFGMLIWCFSGMQLLHKAEYIYVHFIRSYYTEVCTTETIQWCSWVKVLQESVKFHRYWDRGPSDAQVSIFHPQRIPWAAATVWQPSPHSHPKQINNLLRALWYNPKTWNSRDNKWGLYAECLNTSQGTWRWVLLCSSMIPSVSVPWCLFLVHSFEILDGNCLHWLCQCIISNAEAEVI